MEHNGVWCEDCGEVQMDGVLPFGCRKHPLEVRRDRVIPSYARLTLPAPLVIKTISMSDIGTYVHGVFPRHVVQRRTLFGPVIGRLTDQPSTDDVGLKMQIFPRESKTQSGGWLCLSDESVSNWMRFVRPATCLDEVNSVAFQYEGRIYFVTTKAILSNKEMRVWYAKDYALAMGVSHDFSEVIAANTEESETSDDDTANEDETLELKTVPPTPVKGVRRAPVRDQQYEPVQIPLVMYKAWFICHKCEQVFAREDLLQLHGQACGQLNNSQLQSHPSAHKSSGGNTGHLFQSPQSACNNRTPGTRSEQMTTYSTNVGQQKVIFVRPQTPADVTNSNPPSAELAPESPYIDIVTLDDTDVQRLAGDDDDVDEELDVTTLDDDGNSSSGNLEIDIDSDVNVDGDTIEKPTKTTSPDAKKPTKRSKRERKTIYACKVCDKMYVGLKAWRIHIRSHTGEKPFKCTTCEKAFTSHFKLKRHETIHNQSPSYQCPRCRKSFARADHFKKHLTTHDPNKPMFQCTDCEKSFVTSFACRYHIGTKHQIDQGILKCIICRKDFADKTELMAHYKVHTSSTSTRPESAKQHKCTETNCEKTFFTGRDLRRHMVIHGVKTFLCQFCAESFRRADHLTRHQRLKHKILVPMSSKGDDDQNAAMSSKCPGDQTTDTSSKGPGNKTTDMSYKGQGENMTAMLYKGHGDKTTAMSYKGQGNKTTAMSYKGQGNKTTAMSCKGQGDKCTGDMTTAAEQQATVVNDRTEPPSKSVTTIGTSCLVELRPAVIQAARVISNDQFSISQPNARTFDFNLASSTAYNLNTSLTTPASIVRTSQAVTRLAQNINQPPSTTPSYSVYSPIDIVYPQSANQPRLAAEFPEAFKTTQFIIATSTPNADPSLTPAPHEHSYSNMKFS